jgi:hypothetical protein
MKPAAQSTVVSARLSRRGAPRRGALFGGVALAAALAVGLSGCTSTVGYAAVVNGSVISQNAVNQELADIAGNTKYVALINQGGSGPVAGSTAGTYNKSFVALVLNQLIQFDIIQQKLAAGKAEPTAAQVTAARTAVSQNLPSGTFAGFSGRHQTLLATQQADADAFVNLMTANVSPDALNQYYQAHVSTYTTEWCVRHILVADKDASGQLDYTSSLADAKKVKALLDAGGDFAALAKQYSQDNQGTTGGSAAQGGVLTGSATDGCLTSQDLQSLVAEFAQAVIALPANQVSDPVKTQFGYHLIEVTKVVAEPLDATVTADIRQRMAFQQLSTLVGKARVKINPVFGSFDATVNASGQFPGVIPPVVPNVGATTTSTLATGGTSSTGPGSTSGG